MAVLIAGCQQREELSHSSLPLGESARHEANRNDRDSDPLAAQEPEPASRITAADPFDRARQDEVANKLVQRIGVNRGICVMLDPPNPTAAIDLARVCELLVYVQMSDEQRVVEARRSADVAGLLGSRIYIERGSADHIHLADNLADAVVVFDAMQQLRAATKTEAMRVLRPAGTLIADDVATTKPLPGGTDDWSHPYHGPDNNPQSTDEIARAPYLTQFLAEPFYCPMPEVTVAAGGRMFKAFGHISFKQREWPLLNTLIAINGYNGAELWRRKLHEGFMIHRNTMIATPEILYLADDQSCKLLDAATGRLVDEIVAPETMSDKVWKWMALSDGVLFALLGGQEYPADVLRRTRDDAGFLWSELGKGYARQDSPWSTGYTVLAIDVQSKNVLWSHHSSDPIDSRAACMSDGRIFIYSHGKYLSALNQKTGQPLWKTNDKRLLAAIGQHARAQSFRTGFSTTSYVKCSEEAVYFAGPQRQNLVAVSAADGRLLWQYPHGDFQLIVRDDAVYAMGSTDSSKKFDPLTGRLLSDLQCFRGNCTRSTATLDSIFTRGDPDTGGTGRLILDGDVSTYIAPMRPACQDGVIVSGGLLYWGPWMCDCNLSLVGVIALGPAGDFDFQQSATETVRLETVRGDSSQVVELPVTDDDWTGYRGGPTRQSRSSSVVGTSVEQRWQFRPTAKRDSTSAVTAAGFAFIAGADGSVRAFDSKNGEPRWISYTGGAIRYAPAVWRGRLFVGSDDGWVYCFEAATGGLVWRFRAAPAQRKIPVYGKLVSTWPLAGGVVVGDGVVYAAAGIASYDGTHVYSLDAVTGNIRWQNNTSGRSIEDDHSVNGVSVQGHLLLHEDKLYLAGGNFVSPAVFDTVTGRCLNRLDEAREEFAAEAPRGRELFLVGREVMAFDQLLYGPENYQRGKHFPGGFLQASSGDLLVRGRDWEIVRIESKRLGGLWRNKDFRNPAALALAADAIVVAGQVRATARGQSDRMVLATLELKSGKTRWVQTLPAAPKSWGLAIDRDGRVLVTLVDGRVVCFGRK